MFMCIVFKKKNSINLYVQNMQFHSDSVLIFCIHLNAVDVTEIGEKCHQVCFGVNHMAYTVFGPDQQRHFCVFLALLQKRGRELSARIYISLSAYNAR